MDVPFNKAMEIAAFAPLLPIVDKVKNSDLEGAVADVMSSMPVIKLFAQLDLEMPRAVLKKVFTNQGVLKSIQKFSAVPQLKAPMDMLQKFADNLDAGMDELLDNFEQVITTCKNIDPTAGFKFPQDLIKSLSPVDMLSAIGEKIPAPFNDIYNKALELAAFAPLLPIVDKVKNSDLEGAVADVMSSMPVIKLFAQLDLEMPRAVLKKVFMNQSVKDVMKKVANSSSGQLCSAIAMLQKFADNLDAGMDELLDKFAEVLKAFKNIDPNAVGFKFPQDLIKGINPLDILSEISHRIPAPFRDAFNKALELAAFAPLLPVVNQLRNKDMFAAVAEIVSSMSVLQILAKYDAEMPRKILKMTLLNPGEAVLNFE